MVQTKQTCTKDNPFYGQWYEKRNWLHPDKEATGHYNNDGDEEVKCPHCNMYFYEEMAQ